MTNNILLMPFINTNDNPLYIYGFEAGQIWERLKYGEKLKGYSFHSENIEQMHLICEYYEVKYAINPIDEIWSELTTF